MLTVDDSQGGMKPIRLSDEPAFALDSVSVDPASRTIARADAVASIEPRMMQVLMCLAREPGKVIGRQTLIDACWEGRIVGEDAINRAILKLRRALDDLGGGVTIDTVARVGYRLTGPEAVVPDVGRAAQAPVLPRRRLILGGGVALSPR